MLGVFTYNKAWRVFILWMEERLQDKQGICEYIEEAVADSRQEVILYFVVEHGAYNHPAWTLFFYNKF